MHDLEWRSAPGVGEFIRQGGQGLMGSSIRSGNGECQGHCWGPNLNFYKHCPSPNMWSERIRFSFGNIGGFESIVLGTGLTC